jgi:hypothetical protein
VISVTFLYCHQPRLGYVWKICMMSCLMALLSVCLCTPMALCGLSILPCVLHARAQGCYISNITYAAPMAQALKVGCARNGQAKHTYIHTYIHTHTENEGLGPVLEWSSLVGVCLPLWRSQVLVSGSSRCLHGQMNSRP